MLMTLQWAAPILPSSPAKDALSLPRFCIFAALVIVFATSLLPAQSQDSLSGAVSAISYMRAERKEHKLFHRPLELRAGAPHRVDRSYPYGSTQLERRPVHLGVEFVSPRFTPVYAADAGRVVFAGSDQETQLGPRLDYYGNVVVLAHTLRSLSGRRIFTLYGHLDSINVEAGQRLDELDFIGTVGSSGVAIGAHLHFEVRVDDPFDYRKTLNPELWLQHLEDKGMIIGSLRDAAGNFIFGKRLTIRADGISRDVYTYSSEVVNPDPVWNENFTLGDLEAGDYEILVLDAAGKLAHHSFQTVDAYGITFVEIVLDS